MAFLKNIWKTNNSKHKKLPEELSLQNPRDIEMDETDEIDIIENDNNEEIVTFKLKYLGSTVVEKVSGENINVEAVKNIIKVAKASEKRKKLQRVNLNISLKGIQVNDLQGNEILQISIYRISNCSTDASHKQVFSFISTDTNETTECHAFLCSKRKLAETVTLAIAHAFSTAYEAWRILPTTKKFENNVKHNDDDDDDKIEKDDTNNIVKVIEEKLIDFEDEDDFCNLRSNTSSSAKTTGRITTLAITDIHVNNNKWVSFEDDFLHESMMINNSITATSNPWRNNNNQNDLILA